MVQWYRYHRRLLCCNSLLRWDRFGEDCVGRLLPPVTRDGASEIGEHMFCTADVDVSAGLYIELNDFAIIGQ